MAAGTYTSPKRVERDGRLVAFEGEVMTMADAEKRGLVAPVAANAKEAKPKGPTKDELAARLKELGVEFPAKASKAELESLLAAASSPDDDGDQGQEEAAE